MPPIFDKERNILFREYGRNVQNMVTHILQQEDRNKRNQLSRTLIEVMRMLNPQPSSDTPEYYQKVWDHLHIMAGLKLDVDSPFPVPTPESLYERPKPLKPVKTGVRFRNYGRNLELVINRIIAMEDPLEREGGLLYLGKLIKNFYAVYNKDLMDDQQVVNHIKELSNGKLTFDLAAYGDYSPFAQSKEGRAVHNFQNENRPQNQQGQQNFRRNQGGNKRRRY